MANVSFRTDAQTDRALAELTADGSSASEAVRRAVLDQARQRRQSSLRAEAERLSLDPEYLAEVRRVQEDMEGIRAW